MDVGFVSGRATPGQDAHWPGRIAMDFSSLYLPLCGWCPTSRPPKFVDARPHTNMDRKGKRRNFRRNETKTRPTVVFFWGGKQTVWTKKLRIWWYLGYMLPKPGCQSSKTRMILHVFWVRGIPTLNPNCYWKRGPHPTYGVDAVILGVCGDGNWQERIEGLGQVESEQIYHKMIKLLNRCWKSVEIVLFPSLPLLQIQIYLRRASVDTLVRTSRKVNSNKHGLDKNHSTKLNIYFCQIGSFSRLEPESPNNHENDLMGGWRYDAIFGTTDIHIHPFKRGLDWVVVICHVNSSPGHFLCHTQPEELPVSMIHF